MLIVIEFSPDSKKRKHKLKLVELHFCQCPLNQRPLGIHHCLSKWCMLLIVRKRNHETFLEEEGVRKKLITERTYIERIWACVR